MALFDEVQFPVDISQGAKQGPEFKTLVTATANPAESRVGLWSQGRMYFDVSYSVKSPAQMDAVNAFFRARQGRLRGFRFKDWTDYRAVGVHLGSVVAPFYTMQLSKAYVSGSVTSVRRISKPVSGTVQLWGDHVGGYLMVENTDYTLDYTTGVVTVLFGHEFPTAYDMWWTGQFDVPVRFDTDRLQYQAEDVGIRHWEGIPIVEVPL